MEDRQLIEKIRSFKEKNKYTLHDLSRLTDMHITTIERWFKSGRINKVYAKIIIDKLGI